MSRTKRSIIKNLVENDQVTQFLDYITTSLNENASQEKEFILIDESQYLLYDEEDLIEEYELDEKDIDDLSEEELLDIANELTEQEYLDEISDTLKKRYVMKSRKDRAIRRDRMETSDEITHRLTKKALNSPSYEGQASQLRKAADSAQKTADMRKKYDQRSKIALKTQTDLKKRGAMGQYEEYELDEEISKDELKKMIADYRAKGGKIVRIKKKEKLPKELAYNSGNMRAKQTRVIFSKG